MVETKPNQVGFKNIGHVLEYNFVNTASGRSHGHKHVNRKLTNSHYLDWLTYMLCLGFYLVLFRLISVFVRFEYTDGCDECCVSDTIRHNGPISIQQTSWKLLYEWFYKSVILMQQSEVWGGPLFRWLNFHLALGRPWRCREDLLCSESHWLQIFCMTESWASSAAWRTSWTKGPALLGSSFTASRYAGLSLLQTR